MYNWAQGLLSPVGIQQSNLTIRDQVGDGQRIINTKTCTASTFNGQSSGATINGFISKALTLYVSRF
jgi:hypothetical protein